MAETKHSPTSPSASVSLDEAKVRALEATLIEGEQSGGMEIFDFDAFLKKKRTEYEAARIPHASLDATRRA